MYNINDRLYNFRSYRQNKYQTGGRAYFSAKPVTKPEDLIDKNIELEASNPQDLSEEDTLSFYRFLAEYLNEAPLSTEKEEAERDEETVELLEKDLEVGPSVTSTSLLAPKVLELNIDPEKLKHYAFTSSGEKYDKLDTVMKDLITIFEIEGVPIKIASGFRLPGLAGKAGAASHHTKGMALDIVPEDGHSWDEIRDILVNNANIREYLLAHNLGYIDETSEEVMQKTGATGPHFHIGPDQWAVRDYTALVDKAMATQSALKGAKLFFNKKALAQQEDDLDLDFIPSVSGDSEEAKSLILFSSVEADTDTYDNKESEEDAITDDTSKETDFIFEKTDMLNRLAALGYGGETGKTLVAQMALETGHGKKTVGNFNFANITAGKSWKGDTVKAIDNHNGKEYTFRSYETLAQGLQDYIRLIQVYDILPGDSKETVISKLNGNNHGNRHWAEAESYGNKLLAVYDSYWA